MCTTAPGREADGFRDLRERDPHSRIPFCAGQRGLDAGENVGYTAAFSTSRSSPEGCVN
jgi:hypothetical protein